MAIAAIQGLRGTGEFTVDFRPTNYREYYTFLEPNGDAPLNALLAMTSSESTDDPKYTNFSDHMPDRKMTVSGLVAADGTSVVFAASDENDFIIPGTILVVADTGEVMHVTAWDSATETATVSRHIGGSATGQTIPDTSEVFVAGFAAKEGADTPDPITFDATTKYNYTQIFRTAFSVSGTLQKTYLRTGPKEAEARDKALKLHMSDIERMMFFGDRDIQNASTSEPTRFTGGIFNEITGVTDADSDFNGDGGISEDQFDRFLIDTVFAWGSKEKVVFCGPTIAGHMQKMGKDRWSPSTFSGSYGVNFTKYTTFAGDLLLHVHPQFRRIPGMADAAVFLDFPYIRYRYLDGRDTNLLEGRQGNGEDRVKHEYLTECGLEMLQDLPHHAIKNWSTLDVT